MTLLLSASDARDLLSTKEVIAAVERAHADLASGVASNPATSGVRVAGADAVFLPMAASSARDDIAVVKLLGDIPGNRERGLPTQRSTILVVSATTGECLAIIDGQIPTRERTAAASAVASKYLARPDSSVLGLVGAGRLAVAHVDYLSAVLPIEQIVVWSRSQTTRDQFGNGVAHHNLPVLFVDSPEEVVGSADVVCTLTPSKEPVVQGKWLRTGQHINAVGAPPRPDHREVDSLAIARSVVIVDSTEITLQKSGDTVLAIADHTVGPEIFDTELGHVITGEKLGRSSADQITLFNSVGIAVQDLAVVKLLLDRARELGRGQQYAL